MARGRQTVVLQTLGAKTGEKHWLINMFPIEIAIWSASPHLLDKPKLCIANSSSVPFEILMCLAVQIEIQTVGHGVVLGLPIHFYRCPNSGLALDGKGIETH